MADELNPAIIKRTQETLGKYVKKPSLTEKLLRKPPFRFLHDVFSVAIRDTGCFNGLYTPEELKYENIKDRDDKMKFLQKMIDVVKLTTGSSLAVRTSKIVAGHEPEKTNELLQLMGEIIEKKLDWQTALEQVLSGKSARNESPRKPKDSSKKVTKDIPTKDKHKAKSKEKESKTKDSKATKGTSSKTVTTTKRDEKPTMNKTKDKLITKSVAKERTSKGNKEPDKPLKKTTKETSTNSKSKLTKTESYSSKSSPSPNTQESKKDLKSIQNETDCKHEEMTQQMESDKIDKNDILTKNNTDNEVSNTDKVPIDNLQNSLQSSPLEGERLSGGKSKKTSAKKRKSSGRKIGESFGETVQDNEITNNLELDNVNTSTQEKSEISEAEATISLKQDLITPTVNQQQLLPEYSEAATFKKVQPPQTQTQKQPQASPPNSFTNEIKRESTFTRDNSKESSSNQSSLINRPRTSLRPPSARPPSARPGAPRRRDKNIEIILQPNDQIKMSGIQVKLETFGDLDDDGENLVIIENPNTNDVTIDQQTNSTESEKIMQDGTIEQGHLVQQILETQKELVQQQKETNNQQKSEKDSTNGSVMRQTSARHMNNLRDVIQNLTKSVNPLGKLMDFIPEDVDAMQLEFTMWRDAYTQAANELKREKSLTDSATEPMKMQLIQIEANRAEYMEMIDASRVKILQNSEKILKMLIIS